MRFIMGHSSQRLASQDLYANRVSLGIIRLTMPDLSDTTTQIFIAIALIVLAAYVIGIERNIRKGNDALRWIREGLGIIGDKTTLQWRGSSVVELKIQKAKDPFRSADLLVVLEPRDVPLLWLFNRSRKRRDYFIFRAQLRSAPRFDLEASSPDAWIVGGKQDDPAIKYTAVQGGIVQNMRADYAGPITPAKVNELITSSSQQGLNLMSISVHRAVPNLELHYLLPKENFDGAKRTFDAFRKLSDLILTT